MKKSRLSRTFVKHKFIIYYYYVCVWACYHETLINWMFEKNVDSSLDLSRLYMIRFLYSTFYSCTYISDYFLLLFLPGIGIHIQVVERNRNRRSSSYRQIRPLDYHFTPDSALESMLKKKTRPASLTFLWENNVFSALGYVETGLSVNEKKERILQNRSFVCLRVIWRYSNGGM